MVKVILLFSIQSVTFVAMKKIIRLYRRWYYRKLYTRLFFAYLKHESTSNVAYNYAEDAFLAITGRLYSDFRDE